MKLEFKNKNGAISFDLKRDIPIGNFLELAQMTAVLLSSAEEREDAPFEVNTSPPSNDDDIAEAEIIEKDDQDGFISENALQRRNRIRQEQIENPVVLDETQLGTYKEPDEGVRIKVLDYPHIVAAVRIFRNCTGIKVTECKAIIEGKAVCPKLVLETANQMMSDFKEAGIVAKIVDVEQKNWKWQVFQGGKTDGEGEGLTEAESAL